MNPATLDALIAANVREWREYRRMTQQELAQRSGISRTYISQIERGQGNLSVRLVYQLAVALRCNVEELLPPISEIK